MKATWYGIDQTQARAAEIAHGSGRRADIQWIARRNENHAQRSQSEHLLLQVGVALQPFLVELQQPASLFIADALFAHGEFHVLAELVEQGAGIVLNVVKTSRTVSPWTTVSSTTSP